MTSLNQPNEASGADSRKKIATLKEAQGGDRGVILKRIAVLVLEEAET